MQREAVEILRTTYPQDHPQLAMRRRLFGPNSIGVGGVELDLAIALILSGNHEEAEAIRPAEAAKYRELLNFSLPAASPQAGPGS